VDGEELGVTPAYNLDDYVPVNERLEQFRKDHPDWSLLAEVQVDDGDRVRMVAWVVDDAGRKVACGHAEEIRGRGQVNQTSPVENCETSAWGRALACLGYEVKRGVASREEMEKVSRARVRPQRKTSGKEGTSKDNEPGSGNEPVLAPWQAIAAVAQRFGISDDDRKKVMVAVSGKERSRDLTVDEVTNVMRQLRWIADGFVRIDDQDGKPVLVDARPENPGPGLGQRVDG
jgi:hypothetical protein